MNKGGKTYPVITSVLFMMFLCFPMVYKTFDNTEQIEVSEAENRNLAPEPKMDITYLDIFPKQYTAYYEDHFPLRDDMILFFGKNIRYRIFGESPVPNKVALGREGWMFQAENRKVYSGELDFTPEEVEKLYQIFHERAQYLASQGIEFYLLIAPMKCEVYPDKLPNYYRRDPEGIRTDKIVERIKEDSLIRYIDIKKALLRVKDSIQVYKKTDQHWSSAGGFVVYKEVMRHLIKSYPNLKVLNDTDLTVVTDSNYYGGLTTMARLSPEISEADVRYYIKKPKAHVLPEKKYTPPYWFVYPGDYEIRFHLPDSTLPSLLVIRDSFTNQSKDFLSENFNNTIFIFDAWMYNPNYDIIANEKPDIVILEVYEPLFHHLLGLPPH